MPGFNDLAAEIASGYTTSQTEDTVDRAGDKPMDKKDPPAGGTPAGESGGAIVTRSGTLPFGFEKPEEASTGGPDCIPALGGTSTSSSSATDCCTTCTIQAKQDEVARQSVCDTMKARVEAWFLDNGCPVQITSLPSTTASSCGCAATTTSTTTTAPTSANGTYECKDGMCIKL